MRVNWVIATVLSSTIMATAMLYIVTEWCLQSHLSTASMSDAARGLYLTRRFRWLTSPFRDAIHYAIEVVYAVCKFVLRKKNGGTDKAVVEPRQHRRSVRWTKRSTKESHHKDASSGISMDDLTPGRPRASSDAPLIMGNDVSTGTPSILDADAASHQSSRSPQTSSEHRTSTDIESPSRLHVPDARSAFVRYASDRRLSV